MQDAAQLSEDQILDLIHLWRMCSTRRGQLANARKTKLTQIPVECFSDVQMPNPRENVANLTEMANFIKENGTEDFKVYSDTMCAIYRGVSCLSCLFWAPPAQLSVLQWCVPGAILSQLERSGSPASEVSASEVSASKVSASEVSANVAVA